jgi:predicted AlkP superfamily pyrophosphatase or phosphodiesterase
MKNKTLIILFTLTSILISQTKPYVILISFDAFRWDYLNRGITPNLDKLKNEGVSALSLRPTFPSKTFPNHLSIITGMYNDHHGIISNYFVDPFTNDIYRLGDTNSVRDSKWYLGEFFWETAERNGIKTGSYFWPGSELRDENRRPTIYKKYDHNKPYNERIDGVIDWLKLPQNDKPKFITLYFHDTDTYGHDFGPNSQEIDKSISRVDSLIGYLTQSLENINILDSTNIIVVSDHGMTEISTDKVINLDEILCEYKYKLGGDKPFAFLEPNQNEINEIFDILKKNENHYKVYLKEDLPEYFHYKDHPFIYSIILVAEVGWSLVTDKTLERMKNDYGKGNHGYDNNHTDMHGIFVARGPSFKEKYKTGTLWNIDIYPLLCKIYNISPRANIDGSVERIEFILK